MFRQSIPRGAPRKPLSEDSRVNDRRERRRQAQARYDEKKRIRKEQERAILASGTLADRAIRPTPPALGLRLADLSLSADEDRALAQATAVIAREPVERDLLEENDLVEGYDQVQLSELDFRDPEREGYNDNETWNGEDRDADNESDPGSDNEYRDISPTSSEAESDSEQRENQPEMNTRYNEPEEEQELDGGSDRPEPEEERELEGGSDRLQTGDGSDADLHGTISSPPRKRLRARNAEDSVDTMVDNAYEEYPDSWDGFSSRQSHTSGSSEDEPPSALDRTAQKLADQLSGRFPGCTDESHDERLEEHILKEGSNHWSLQDAHAYDLPLPDVLSSGTFLAPKECKPMSFATPSQWEAAFSGIDNLSGSVKNVCMHKETTAPSRIHSTPDIDSCLAFANSLAAAKKGFWYQPVPLAVQNIHTDIHVSVPQFRSSDDAEDSETSMSTQLRNVPHLLLGRPVGFIDMQVHMVFPHMQPTPHNRFQFPTVPHLQRFVDEVVLPAFDAVCQSDWKQHLPSSYQHAYANSRAHQIEARAIEGSGYGSQRSIGYFVQSCYLDQIWQLISSRIEQPGLQDFRDPLLLLSSKGTKLQFKGLRGQNLHDTICAFVTTFEDCLDIDHLDLQRTFVDIGKETCHRDSSLGETGSSSGTEAQTFFWRRCCLESCMNRLYDGAPPKAGTNKYHRYYEQTYLYEACNMTSETKKRSMLREGGLVYSQYYSSVKELYDAAKCFPFSNPALETLAVDPAILQGARSILRGSFRDISVLERAYNHSKSRISAALRASNNRSYGTREEHRVTWALLLALRDILSTRSTAADVDPAETGHRPSHVWAVQTSVYLDFLWRNANKFAAGFELVRASCLSSNGVIPWEKTKIMSMFLRCLTFFLGGNNLQWEPALWWSYRIFPSDNPEQQAAFYGLGFGSTLTRHGYAWILPARISWENLEMRPDITNNMLFGNRVLGRHYLRHGGEATAFFRLGQSLDHAVAWVQEYPRHEDRLIRWIAYLVLRQFRIDVMSAVPTHEIRTIHITRARRAEEGFCQELFEELFSSTTVHTVKGNKTQYTKPLLLASYLFDFDDNKTHQRQHWDKLAFRKLWARAMTQLPSQPMKASLRAATWKLLFRHHWLLPFPHKTGLLQKTKKSDGAKRMWYSITLPPSATTGPEKAESTDWVWGREDCQTGTPPPFPEWLSWNQQQWETYLQRPPPGIHADESRKRVFAAFTQSRRTT